MQLKGRLFVLVRWKWQGTNDAFDEREKGVKSTKANIRGVDEQRKKYGNS